MTKTPIIYTSSPDKLGNASNPKVTTEVFHPRIPKKIKQEAARIINYNYNGDYEAAYDEIQRLIDPYLPKSLRKYAAED